MKILILGSEGFVGKNLTKKLSVTHEVITADMIPGGLQNYTQLDITKYDDVIKTVKDVDAVINLVAHSLTSSLDDTISNATVNILGNLNILEACRKNSIRKMIFTSASSLIGETTDKIVSETHNVKPKTAYGISKMADEHYLRLYNELYGLNYIIFRFFNIYGPYQKNGLIPNLYRRIKQNEPLTVFGKGDQIRDFVYVEDVIPFFDKVISTDDGNNKLFHLGTGKSVSIIEVIKTLSKIMNIDPKIEYKEQRAGEIGNFVSDTSLIESTFGTKPSTTIEEGLKKTIQWLESNN